MEFKHAFHVFVDNFSATYKLLAYRLIVLAVTIGLCCAVLVPSIGCISDTLQFIELKTTFSAMWSDIIAVDVENLQPKVQAFREACSAFKDMLSGKSWLIAVDIVCLCVVFFIHEFLSGVGDYVTGSLVHDKMVMYARSSFSITLFKNIRQASLYAIIYAPLSFLYGIACTAVMGAIIFVGFKGLPVTLVKIFIIALLFLLFSAVKLFFTVDWVPALIDGKMKQRKAFIYTFSRKDKHNASVISTSLVLKLTIFALNVAAGIFTFGAGLLLTLPASTLILSAYSFVNYFDRNKKKYFVDEYTIVGPKKETPATREEFFKGEEQ